MAPAACSTIVQNLKDFGRKPEEYDQIITGDLGYILPKIACGDWKRVLFVPTGALMSKVSFYEGNSVPGIAQGVVLEWEEGEVEQTC